MNTTTSLQSFVKSLTPGNTFTTAEAAEATGWELSKTRRRLGRCPIVQCYKYRDEEGNYQPVTSFLSVPKGATLIWKALEAPTKSKVSDRVTVRKDKVKREPVDILAVRQHVQEAKFSLLGVEAIVHECPVVRREAFKEVRARVSRGSACRVTYWKAKNARVVTVLGVEAFRN